MTPKRHTDLKTTLANCLMLKINKRFKAINKNPIQWTNDQFNRVKSQPLRPALFRHSWPWTEAAICQWFEQCQKVSSLVEIQKLPSNKHLQPSQVIQRWLLRDTQTLKRLLQIVSCWRSTNASRRSTTIRYSEQTINLIVQNHNLHAQLCTDTLDHEQKQQSVNGLSSAKRSLLSLKYKSCLVTIICSQVRRFNEFGDNTTKVPVFFLYWRVLSLIL